MKFAALFWKETLHLRRDPKSLFLIMLLPLIMLLVYGYVIRLDIKNIAVCVVDHDRSSLSRQLISDLDASDYFSVKPAASMKECSRELVKGTGDACLVIARGTARKVLRGEPASLLFVVDGSDPNLASGAINYFNLFLQKFSAGRGYSALSVAFFYNPELRSSHFFVPGLAAIILMMICAMLTSITIVREKEQGTFLMLRTSPVSSFQLIAAKLAPYTGLAFFEALFILTVATLWFSVPFRGSVLLLAATIVVYVMAGLSFGVFISTVAASQATAMIMSLVLTILPSVILSGFIFPIKSMPPLLQAVTYIIPARYFLIIIRGIMLMGAELRHIWAEILALLAFAFFFMVLSTKRLRRQLK